ncbi:hypothetical protein [Saccharothrix variisporea]|uniref:Uncharacterized protein n=1 Tax=Saccharothrix variisporea TaxID=543527 RepID=A0A495XL11_9PSEU|nr:hypothetical protein [Saccharothrix variisporea]RKT73113.1 hypothetical protein DFJ66_6440 [Saccharothrix variisporea]
MTALLIVLTVLALVVYGLERNHHRGRNYGSHLAGSYDVEDRDLIRVETELHAAADHQPARPAPRHARFTPRSV